MSTPTTSSAFPGKLKPPVRRPALPGKPKAQALAQKRGPYTNEGTAPDWTASRPLLNPLFAAHGAYWVDAHGAARRDVTGQQGDGDEQRGDARERGGVGRRNAVEQLRHQPREYECAHKAQRRADQRQSEALANNQQENIFAAGAERNANADLVRAPRDRVADHAVNSNGSQRQRNGCKYTEQQHLKTRLRVGFRDDTVHGEDVGDRQIAIKRPNGALHGRCERGGIARGAHDECYVVRVRSGDPEEGLVLKSGDIQLGVRLPGPIMQHRIFHYADYSHPIGNLVAREGDALTKRIPAWPKRARHGLVDHDDGRRAGSIRS